MNIYVGNLSYQLSEDELKDVFAEFGTVDKAKIITDRESGRSKGFGFVEMPNDEEGQKAIDELNGSMVKDRNLKVNQARPKTDKPRKKSW